jgi:hypothetical protein
LANKGLRARVRTLLSAVDQEGRADRVAAELAKPRRKVVRKWGVITIRERVAEALEKRRRTIGWNFFKQPYTSEAHRERFVDFLEALVQERDGEGRHHARTMAFWLPGAPRLPGYRGAERNRQWLAQFFRDEPAWEGRLKAWISSFSEET